MVWHGNKANMEHAKKALGNLDTPATTKLRTFLGNERSINAEAVRDTDGKVLFPPRDRAGNMLPFYSEGELRRGTGQAHPDFSWWQTEINPNAYGLRDILRYVDAPPDAFAQYDTHPAEYPECKHCPNAELAPGCTNGAQVTCRIQARFGRFEACTIICRKVSIAVAKDEIVLGANIAPVLAAAEQTAANIAEAAQYRQERDLAKEKPIKRRKAPPLKRVTAKPVTTDTASNSNDNTFIFTQPPPPPIPRSQDEMPQPRRRRRLIGKQND